MPNGPTILAIESAIRGGSLSLIRDGRELASWVGAAETSRAEELLLRIDEILKRNGLSQAELGLIAVSAGPGSFTGIRIGIATALGLARGLDVPVSSVSALEAIARGTEFDGSAIVAVPAGRLAVCRQQFQWAADGSLLAVDEPRSISEEAFAAELSSYEGASVLQRSLLSASPNAIDAGENIAYAVGIACASSPGVMAEPLFVSKS